MAITVNEKPRGYEKNSVVPINLSAGQNLKIEVGEDELALVVPMGKTWKGMLYFHVVEVPCDS